jgi:hypothetical protein
VTAQSAAIRGRIRSKLRRQRALVAELLEVREQLQGSLFTRYGECGKDGCACGRGRRHGPYHVLSTRSGGRGGFSYLGRGQVARARVLVARHRAFRAGLTRLRALNEDVLRLLRSYQRATTRQGGRRLGLAARAARPASPGAFAAIG